MTPEPGQVFWAFHDKRRPVIVVSRHELNAGDYVVVVPLTSARLEDRRKQPNCVALDSQRHHVPKSCVAQAEAIAVLPKSDLDLSEGPVSVLDDSAMRDVIRAIGNVISACCEPE